VVILTNLGVRICFSFYTFIKITKSLSSYSHLIEVQIQELISRGEISGISLMIFPIEIKKARTGVAEVRIWQSSGSKRCV